MNNRKQSSLPQEGSRPINRTALLVTLPGEHWDPSAENVHGALFESPPHCNTPPEKNIHFNGLRRGKLIAVGFFRYNRNHKPIWLMRCDCGLYTLRFIVGWARRIGVFDQCPACEYAASLNHVGRSRQTHGLRRARWVAKLRDFGFTEKQIVTIQQYNLPADDLDWLKQVLDQLST